MEHRLYYWKISCIIGRPIVVLEDLLYYWKSSVLLEDLLRCWKMNGRSKVLLENQLYWRQSTGLDGNYRSRKITTRRWLHKYVGAECGASSFTWYLYQMCNTDVRPSVRPSVCRRHGFWSISQVCFGISISNFICMLMVAIGRRLLIFSDVTFKMAAWRPYWIFWFPDSNFTLALIINFKLQRHNTYVYG